MTVAVLLALAAAAAGGFVYKERRGIRRLPPTPVTDHFCVVVTGANRGIGKEIVSALLQAQTSMATIVLCSRSSAEGEKVAANLQSEMVDRDESRPHELRRMINVVAMVLDVENQSSIDDAIQQLRSSPGHVDVLINNAAIAYKMADETPFPMQASQTVAVNYEGTKRCTAAFLPLLGRSKVGGRVISVSSMAGVLGRNGAARQAIFSRFTNCSTVAELDSLVTEFVSAAQNGSHREQGFSGSAYSVSKSAVTHWSRVQEQVRPEGCRFAAACPGFCRTDMAGGQWTSALSVVVWALSWIGGKSARAGADTPAFLAMCSAQDFDAFAGTIVQDRKLLGF